MNEPGQLHLVDARGVEVDTPIRDATEAAFRWVAKDNPNIDRAQLADWAEAVARSMQTLGGAIEFPERYAYAALKGKVRDWFKTATAREQTAGVRQDMERIGGVNGAFQGTVDRRIMFDQVKGALSERDRDILVLILNEKSALEVAEELKTSHPAARKAIQRVRERIGALLGSSDNRSDGAKDSSVNQRGLTVE